MHGTLTVVCGPMFAGKTTALLQMATTAHAAGRRVLALKTAFDDRYAAASIVTHDGQQMPALAIRAWADIPATMAADLLVLDEVQFFQAPQFGDDIVTILRDHLRRGGDVLAGGLDMDWQGRAFPVTAQLGAMADYLVKLTAACQVCGRAASKTQKKSASGPRIEKGAGDLYEARCNRHWDRVL